MCDLRSHISKGSFTHVSATNVLVHKNVLIFHQILIWTQRGFVIIFTIRRNAITGSLHQERIFLRFRNVFWNIYRSEKFNTISHRDINFFFGIMLLNKIIIGLILCKSENEANSKEKLKVLFHRI